MVQEEVASEHEEVASVVYEDDDDDDSESMATANFHGPLPAVPATAMHSSDNLEFLLASESAPTIHYQPETPALIKGIKRYFENNRSTPTYDGDFEEYSDFFEGFCGYYELPFKDINTWKPGQPASICKAQDSVLALFLLEGFKKSSLSSVIRSRYAKGSGLVGWYVLRQRFNQHSRLNQQRRWKELMSVMAACPKPHEDRSKLDDHIDKLNTAIAKLEKTRPTLQSIMLFSYIQQLPAEYDKIKADLYAHSTLTFRVIHERTGLTMESAKAANTSVSNEVTGAFGASTDATLLQLAAAVSQAFGNSPSPPQPRNYRSRGRYHGSHRNNSHRCLRCAQNHATDNCNLDPRVRCARCNKPGHKAIVCRSVPTEEYFAANVKDFSKSAYLGGNAFPSTVIDSGAGVTVVPSRRHIHSALPLQKATPIVGVSGELQNPDSVGTYLSPFIPNAPAIPAQVHDRAPAVLESLAALHAAGAELHITKDRQVLVWQNQEIPLQFCNNALTYAQDTTSEPTATPVFAGLDILEAHRRAGHRSFETLDAISKQVSGLPLAKIQGSFPVCPGCAQGDSSRSPIRKGPHSPRSTGPRQVSHVDLLGIKTRSSTGNKYCVVFVDDYSKYRRCYSFPECNAETLVKAIRAWRRDWLGAAPGKTSTPEGLTLIADHAFASRLVQEQMDLYNWKLQFASPHEHGTHGVAERTVGLVSRLAWSYLHDCNLPSIFWDFATDYACWTLNRLPSPRTSKVPAVIHGCGTADLSPSRQFGTLVAYHQHNPSVATKSDFAAKGSLGIFLGCSSRHSFGTSRIMSLDSRRIVFSRSYRALPYLPQLSESSDYIRKQLLNNSLLNTAPVKVFSNDYGDVTSSPSSSDFFHPLTKDTSSLILPSNSSEIKHPSSPSFTNDVSVNFDLAGSSGENDEDLHFSYPAQSTPAASSPEQEVSDLIDFQQEVPDLISIDQEVPDLISIDQEVPDLINIDQEVPDATIIEKEVPDVTIIEQEVDSSQKPPRKYKQKPSYSSEFKQALREFVDAGPLYPGQVLQIANNKFHWVDPILGDVDTGSTTRSGKTFHPSSSTSAPALLTKEVNNQEASTSNTHVYEDPRRPVREPRHESDLRLYSDYEKAMWRKTDEEEMANHAAQETLQEVPKSEVRGKVLDVMKVYKKKPADNEGRRRLKMRLVVRGDQEPTSEQEVASPVTMPSSVRIQITLGLTQEHDFAIFDITSAFLTAPVHDKDIFIRVRTFYGEYTYYRLLKSVYGISSAPLRFYKELAHAFDAFGLAPCPDDACLFHHKGLNLTVSTHVDDGLVSGPASSVKALEGHLKSYFGNDKVDFEHLPDNKRVRYLGAHLTINRSSKIALLDHADFIEELLETHGLNNCQPRITPASANPLTFPKEAKTDPLYQSLVGSLQWVVNTRPDIAFAVKELGRHNRAATEEHFTAAKAVLRYLAGTSNIGIVLRGAIQLSDIKLEAWCDASYAPCPYTRRSTLGYLLAVNGSTILTKSSTERTVALSSTEAELYAANEAAKAIIWNRRILDFLGCPQADASPLYTDNQAIIPLIRNLSVGNNSKHVDIRRHHLHQLLEDNIISLSYENTRTNPADVLTKHLSRELHHYHIYRICLAFLGHVTPGDTDRSVSALLGTRLTSKKFGEVCCLDELLVPSWDNKESPAFLIIPFTEVGLG